MHHWISMNAMGIDSTFAGKTLTNLVIYFYDLDSCGVNRGIVYIYVVFWIAFLNPPEGSGSVILLWLIFILKDGSTLGNLVIAMPRITAVS